MQRLILCACAAAGLAIASQSSASTIAYWRFEGASLGTDSVGSNTLSTVGTVSQYTLPGSGAGSKFPDPLPGTATANDKAVDVGTRAGHLTVDTATTKLSTFTFEALVNIPDTTSTSYNFYIASQWESSGVDSDRRWAIGVKASGTTTKDKNNVVISTGKLLLLTSNATGTTTIVTQLGGLTISSATDYYVGLAIDGSSGNATAYLKDLSSSSNLLQSASVTGVPITSTAATEAMAIGKLSPKNEANNRWYGYIDEVRLSNTVLNSSQLLIVPEPASSAIGALGAGLLLLRRRAR